MIDLDLFKERYMAYKYIDYANDFYGFWKWKISIEEDNGHILDNNHRDETYQKLSYILPRWLTYRPKDSSKCLEYLKDSLEKIAIIYDEIREINLLNFNRISDKKLLTIWHELGRAKEEQGIKKNNGQYFVIAVTKPLMFLWGQTPAFDSIVRDNMLNFGVQGIRRRIWSYDTWKNVLTSIQGKLKQQPYFVKICKDISKRDLGSTRLIPYGQFFDLYYWVGGR